MTELFEETTTAASSAKALDVSRRTVNRYLASGRLDDGGLGPDGERRVTLSSLTRLKAGLDIQRHRAAGDDTADTESTGGVDPLLTRTLAMLEEELRARRDEAANARETLLLTERSSATVVAERDRYRDERDRLTEQVAAQEAQADKVRQVVASVSDGGPLHRWKARRRLAQELADV